MILKMFIAFFIFLPSTYSQQESEKLEELSEEKEEFKRHSIGFFISHTHIDQGRLNGERSWLAAPSLALNYNFLINEKWGIGWHNDLIIEKFIVEDSRDDSTELERVFPFSTMLAGFYKPSESWSIVLGGGAEYEENKTFGLIRIGTEYGIRIPNLEFEVMLTANFDILIDAYNSINYGIGIAKSF